MCLKLQEKHQKDVTGSNKSSIERCSFFSSVYDLLVDTSDVFSVFFLLTLNKFSAKFFTFTHFMPLVSFYTS